MLVRMCKIVTIVTDQKKSYERCISGENRHPGSTIHIRYRDLGHVPPARYQINRFKMNFLQYILQQNITSIPYKMLSAQQVKGDWFSDVKRNVATNGNQSNY